MNFSFSFCYSQIECVSVWLARCFSLSVDVNSLPGEGLNVVKAWHACSVWNILSRRVPMKNVYAPYRAVPGSSEVYWWLWSCWRWCSTDHSLRRHNLNYVPKLYAFYYVSNWLLLSQNLNLLNFRFTVRIICLLAGDARVKRPQHFKTFRQRQNQVDLQ